MRNKENERKAKIKVDSSCCVVGLCMYVQPISRSSSDDLSYLHPLLLNVSSPLFSFQNVSGSVIRICCIPCKHWSCVRTLQKPKQNCYFRLHWHLNLTTSLHLYRLTFCPNQPYYLYTKLHFLNWINLKTTSPVFMCMGKSELEAGWCCVAAMLKRLLSATSTLSVILQILPVTQDRCHH